VRHPPLLVTSVAAQALRGWVDGSGVRPALRLRARIVLLSGEGHGPAAIGRELGCSTQTVVTWRERFREAGVDGLRDAPRAGRPVSVDSEAVVRATVLAGGAGCPRWSTRSLARHLGISNVSVASVWQRWGVRPGPDGRVQLQLTPVLERLPVSVLGLHVDGALRVAAVLVRDRDEPRTPAPPAGHAAVRSALADLLADATSGPWDRVDGPQLAAFLGGIEEIAVRCGSAEAFPSVRLIVAGPGGQVARWGEDRPAVAVHLVSTPLSWERVVLVACVSAETAGPDGAASVARLRAAMAREPRATGFSWLAPGSG
jgi:transposase